MKHARILSLLMALALVFAMLPATVLARVSTLLMEAAVVPPLRHFDGVIGFSGKKFPL